MGRFGGALDLAIQKDQADRELNVNAALRRREMRNRQKMAEAELAQRQSEFEHKRAMEGDENRRRNLISQREQDFWERTRDGEIEAKNAANRNAIRKGEQEISIAESEEARKQAEADRKQKDWEETRGFEIDKLRIENDKAQSELDDLENELYWKREERMANANAKDQEFALKELEIEEKKLAMKQANDLYNKTQEAFKKQQQEAEALKTAQRTNIVAWFTGSINRWQQRDQNLMASQEDAAMLGKMLGIPGLDMAFVINQDEAGRQLENPLFVIGGKDIRTGSPFRQIIPPMQMTAMLSSIPTEGNTPLANGVSLMLDFFGLKQPNAKTEQAKLEAKADYWKSITGHDAKNLQSALGGTGGTASVDAARSTYEESKKSWGDSIGINQPNPNSPSGGEGGEGSLDDIDLSGLGSNLTNR